MWHFVYSPILNNRIHNDCTMLHSYHLNTNISVSQYLAPTIFQYINILCWWFLYVWYWLESVKRKGYPLMSAIEVTSTLWAVPHLGKCSSMVEGNRLSQPWEQAVNQHSFVVSALVPASRYLVGFAQRTITCYI